MLLQYLVKHYMSAKQAINDKLQGSLATYFRYGEVFNNQIKKGLLLSLRVKNFLQSVNIWQSYKQERDCLVHFARLANTLLKDEESARDSHVPACTFAKPNIYRFKKNCTRSLSNKPFLIWLLTTPPHLKCVATLPCNLSSMACFAHINVSQGSVSTHARPGEIFNIHLTANLPRNLSVKKNLNRLSFDKIMVMSLRPRFLSHPVYNAHL